MRQWIKVRVWPDHPKIFRLAQITGDDRRFVVGVVIQWFVWLDDCDLTTDLDLTLEDIDGVLGVDGYASAFEQIGWLGLRPDGTAYINSIPEHFGGSARRFPPDWSDLRISILDRDSWVCSYCGSEADSVDHLMPYSRGGTEIPENLVACCHRCNSVKKDKTPSEAGMKPVFCMAEVVIP